MVQSEMVDVPVGESWESLYQRLLTSMADGNEVTQRTEWSLLRLPVPIPCGPSSGWAKRDRRKKRRYGSVSAISHP